MSASNPNHPSQSYNIGASTEHTSKFDSPSNNLKIGVVFSGDHCLSSIHVISGIFGYLKKKAKCGTIYIFRDGVHGLLMGTYYELRASEENDHLAPYIKTIYSTAGMFTENQCLIVCKTVEELDLDGLVVVGENDAIVNAQLLTQSFRDTLKTHVVACRGTIDFDTCHWNTNFKRDVDLLNEGYLDDRFSDVCKRYCTIIDYIVEDAQSTNNCYHFVRVEGFAASLKTLWCALRTHPTLALIGEEVFKNKWTLAKVRDKIVDVICQRFERGYNYGVILIPEGLLNFIPELDGFCKYMSILANYDFESNPEMEDMGKRFKELRGMIPDDAFRAFYSKMYPAKHAMSLRIDTEKLMVDLVKTELEKREEYKGDFKEQRHYLGVDPNYVFQESMCYGIKSFQESMRDGIERMGYLAGELIQSKEKNGWISSVKGMCGPDIDRPIIDWINDETPITDLLKEVGGEWELKKDTVRLDGPLFKLFDERRQDDFGSAGLFYGL